MPGIQVIGMGQKDTTINEHYGVKDKEYTEMSKEILIDMIKEGNFNTVIDKHFSKLKDPKDRVKVVCYAEALRKFVNMNNLRD